MQGFKKSVQYNLTISTDDGRIADWVAMQLRKELGENEITAKGISKEPSSNARVLTVIHNPVKNPPFKVLELARRFARSFGVDIVEADIIGDIPLEVVLACAGYALSVQRIRPGQICMEN